MELTQELARKIPRPLHSTAGIPAHSSALPPPSVGSAAPDALHLSQKIDSRRPLDSRARHSGLEFVGCDKGARLFQTLPFKEKIDVVDVSGAAENTTTALAVLAPPVQGGIESRLPGRIVGDFVLDENVDRGVGYPPFTLKRCSKRRKNARARARTRTREKRSQRSGRAG
jgi:hypothetical protein